MTTLRSEIVVVGAGISGIASVIKLKEAGFADVVVLERGDDVGGCWSTQKYPGLTIDVPSMYYSYSWAQKPDWSSAWTPGPEMHEYCRNVVEQFGVRDKFRFGVQVTGSTYDEKRNEWVTETADGTRYVSRYLLNASGVLSELKWPEIEGMKDFQGTLLHTSAWDENLDFTGKRVAIIGTGATGIQLAPEIAPQAGQLDVYQRTPIWLLPKPAFKLKPRTQKAFATVPGLLRAARFGIAFLMDIVFFQSFVNYPTMGPLTRLAEKVGRRHINRQVDDPEVARKLTPDYDWGCKRPSFSQNFYPMFNRSNVELVTDSIERFTPTGIVTADGVEHETDIVICATGYQPFSGRSLPTYPVRGRGGQDLRDYWENNRYQAFQGVTVHGYPNFFLIFGPYNNISGSYIAGVELSVRNMVTALKGARKKRANYIEVDAAAQRREFEEIIAKQPKSIFQAGNCTGSNTYYIDAHGDTPLMRPSNHLKEWIAARRGDLSPYHIRSVADATSKKRTLSRR
ncbi:flavin-containing monooxygenase [Amycolatopsis silviterrae]|uniref:Flavin-containing monooxygenase n=1 Tax=Amycolatopsis silviterrae TaxID=1656914 RepID=A0ABW5HLD8_9PSEU